MSWLKWWRHLLRNRADEPDVPSATAAGPWDSTPVAPPPNNTPNHLQEERDLEPIDTTSTRRWAGAIRFARSGRALLSLIWIMLPHELHDLLIHALQR